MNQLRDLEQDPVGNAPKIEAVRTKLGELDSAESLVGAGYPTVFLPEAKTQKPGYPNVLAKLGENAKPIGQQYSLYGKGKTIDYCTPQGAGFTGVIRMINEESRDQASNVMSRLIKESAPEVTVEGILKPLDKYQGHDNKPPEGLKTLFIQHGENNLRKIDYPDTSKNAQVFGKIDPVTSETTRVSDPAQFRTELALGGIFARTTMEKPIDAEIAKARERGECFDGETQVHRNDGLVEIQYIAVGDMVLSRCEKTGVRAYRKVLQVFKHEYDYDDPDRVEIPQYLVRYTTRDGLKGGVYTTREHPFWVKGQGWIEAINLKPGHELEICDMESLGERADQYRKLGPYQEVILKENGWTATVQSVELTTTMRLPVYNLEVEEFHTYFVDDTGVWVHDSTCNKTESPGQARDAALLDISDKAKSIDDAIV